jgi:hypothetical protein
LTRLRDIVDNGNMRVLDRRRRPRLLNEARFAPAIGDELRRKNLESDLPVQLQVDGAVNDTHAAAADFGEHLVMGDRPADQGALILLSRPGVGKPIHEVKTRKNSVDYPLE